MKVLVTGASGYIGSHAVASLLRLGCNVYGVDNFFNSSPSTSDILSQFNNCGGSFVFAKTDLAARGQVKQFISEHIPAGVDYLMHFAGLKSVTQSTIQPLSYWNSNVAGTINLLEELPVDMLKGVVFSSSCTVYGDKTGEFCSEDQQPNPISVYGETKYACENILRSYARANPHVGCGVRWVPFTGQS